MDELAETISKLIADAVTQATKRALAADPSLRARLLSLDGHCVEIHCTTPPATWHLQVVGDAIQTQPGAALSPNVVVRGTALDLIGWLSPGNAAGQVQISGDDTVLIELLDVLRGFNPDLAEPLSQFVGSETASTILGTAELGLKSLQSLVQGVTHSVQDQAVGKYVQQPQLETMLTGIDNLRLRVDRLAAKVKQQEQKRSARQAN